MVAILSGRIAAKKFTISERTRIHLDGARHISDEETLTFEPLFRLKSNHTRSYYYCYYYIAEKGDVSFANTLTPHFTLATRSFL